MTIAETVTKIKNLEIQGATKIAIAATAAFGNLLKKTHYWKILKKAVLQLSNARATEPALRNALQYCLSNYEKNPEVIHDVLEHFQNARKKIIEFGSQKIKNGMTVFTHCHSGTVTAILIKAWKDGKRFKVHQTETRPRFQGRITAKELAKKGIPVVHGVDSAGRELLEKADIFLFGADSIAADGNVINKIGTRLFAEYAQKNKIPVYACSDSWKFSPETLRGKKETIEKRDPKEVWKYPPKGVKIFNPAFEITPSAFITGIITELGIFKPATLVSKIQKKYPWMIL